MEEGYIVNWKYNVIKNTGTCNIKTTVIEFYKDRHLKKINKKGVKMGFYANVEVVIFPRP